MILALLSNTVTVPKDSPREQALCPCDGAANILLCPTSVLSDQYTKDSSETQPHPACSPENCPLLPSELARLRSDTKACVPW